METSSLGYLNSGKNNFLKFKGENSVKKFIIVVSCILSSFFVFSSVSSALECTSIQDGGLYASDGTLIETGYDQWGYNYQAHMFNGGYCDAYRDAAWCQEYADTDLIMKWNDAWMSNRDCDYDGLLDRHFSHDSYIGSGAWLTNHQSGKVEVNGKMRRWTYFTKIVAAPIDGYVEGGIWHNADGTELGPVIWGSFATVQEVLNDPSVGAHGVLYKSPADPGLGNLN